MQSWFGSTQRAFAALDDNAQAALRSDLEALWSEHNLATDNATHVAAEYLDVVAKKMG